MASPFVREALFIGISIIIISLALLIISSNLRKAGEMAERIGRYLNARMFLEAMVRKCLSDKTGAVVLGNLSRCLEAYEFDYSLDVVFPNLSYERKPISAVIIVDNTGRYAEEIVGAVKSAVSKCAAPEDRITYVFAGGCSAGSSRNSIPISRGSLPLKKMVEEAKKTKADIKIAVISNPMLCEIETDEACKSYALGLSKGWIDALDAPSFGGKVIIYKIKHICDLYSSDPSERDEIVEMVAISMAGGDAKSDDTNYIQADSPQALEKMICSYLGRGRKGLDMWENKHVGPSSSPDFSISRQTIFRKGNRFRGGLLVMNVYSRPWVRFAKALRAACKSGIDRVMEIPDIQINGTKACGEWCIDVGCEIVMKRKDGVGYIRKSGRRVVVE